MISACFFFLLKDRFLRGLRDAELYDGLGRDLDRRTRRRVAACTSGAVLFDELADAWERELAIGLHVLIGHVRHLLKEHDDIFLSEPRLFSEGSHHLAFGHLGHSRKQEKISKRYYRPMLAQARQIDKEKRPGNTKVVNMGGGKGQGKRGVSNVKISISNKNEYLYYSKSAATKFQIILFLVS